MNEPRPLHRLFGLSWADFLQGTDVKVEPELDLSQKQQMIDFVLVRSGRGPLSRPLPDGFEELVGHNLLTFKSHQEALDGWALCELIAHYVNYRKQSSPSMQELLPEADFRLFAVCVRFPQNLARQVELVPLHQGVYDVRFGILTIRIIAIHQLRLAEHNAMLHLFSAKESLLRYGREHYRPYSRETSTLLYELCLAYKEDPDMAIQLDEFVRESVNNMLKKLPVEKRLEGIPVERLLETISAEKRLEGIPVERRLEGIPAEKRIQDLSPDELRAVLAAVQQKLENDARPGQSG